MSRRFIWKRLVLPLGIVLVISAIVLVVVYQRADEKGRAGLELEAGKAMLTVIAAVLVGNIVLIIIRDFEERRKGWLARRDLLRTDLTDGLLELYSRAKSTRRRLRVSIKAATRSIETKRYDKLLQEINDIQLGLERYKRQAEGGVSIGLLPATLPDELKSMEKYLGELVSEYEDVLPAAGDSISLDDLPELRDFIGSYATSNFRSEFVDPYYKIVYAVAEQMKKELTR
jgi:hypothetical protein